MAGQKRQRVRARRGPMRVFILDGPAIHVLLCRPSTHYRKKVIQGPRGNDESFESFSSLCPCHVSVIPGTSVPVLTFVSRCGGFVYECQNQRDTKKNEILVWFLDLTFALRTRGDTEANIKSTTLAVRVNIVRIP